MNTELPLWAFFNQKFAGSKEDTDKQFRGFIKETDKSLKVNTLVILKEEGMETSESFTVHNLKTGSKKKYPSVSKLVIPENPGLNFIAVNFPLPNTKRNCIVVRIPDDYSSIVERFLQGEKK